MTFTPSVEKLNALEQGAETFIYPSKWNDVVVLTAGTAHPYDLTAARTAMGLKAGQALFVIFEGDGPFYANFNAAATVPSGNTTTGVASEFSPSQRLLDSSITAISLISVAAQNVTMSFYRP